MLQQSLPSPPAASKLPQNPADLGKTRAFLEGPGEASFARGLALDVARMGRPKATILSFFSMLVTLQLGF